MPERKKKNSQSPPVDIPIDALTDSACILDETCTILSVNEAWKCFAEGNPPISAQHGVGMNYQLLCDGVTGRDAGEARSFSRGMQAVLEGTEKRFTMEYGCHTPMQDRCFRASVVRFGIAAEYRLLVTHTDVTPQRREGELRSQEQQSARQLLHASDMKYRALFESMKEGAFYQNADGRLEDVNAAALAMMGVTRGDFLGRTSYHAGWDVIAEDGTRLKPDEHPSMMALHGGKPVDDQTIGVWNPTTRSYRWLSASAIPMFREGDPAPFQVFVTLHDLTERKKTEGVLRKQETLYRAIVETSPDGFVILDMTGRITEVNDSYCRLSGYSREDLLEMSIPDLEAAETTEKSRDHMRAVMLKGSDLFETRHRKKDGTIWPVQVSTSYWPIGGGRCFTFFRDLISRHRSDALLGARLRLSSLATSATVKELMQAALDEAELFTGSTVGFFHFVDESQESLTLQAWSTNTRNAACTTEPELLHYPVSKAGVWADCIRTRIPTIHNDLAVLAHTQGMPEGHAAIQRELVVPVLRDDRVTAVFGVGNKRSDYTGDDAEVVKDLASIVMDLVNGVRAQQNRLISEERFRLLYEKSGEGILHTDPISGTILSANSTACRILRMTEEGIRGLGRNGLLDPADPRGNQAIQERAAHGHVEAELRFLRGDGTHCEVNASSTIYTMSDGRVRSDIIFRDVTERRHIEDTLARQRDALGAFAAHLETVRENERTSVAREVHDAFGQILSAIKLDAMALGIPDTDDPEHTSRRISSILSLADSGMTTVHEIAARLRPGILDDLGLLATLEWQIENFQKRTGLTCIAELPDIEVEIAPDVATVIFRCAQTLLTNISLHARVRRVWFRFAYDTHGMTLVVTDDGIGITEDAIDSPRSFGLIGIRERIRPLDGVFTIHPFQPSGTEARITIPHTNARSHHD